MYSHALFSDADIVTFSTCVQGVGVNTMQEFMPPVVEEGFVTLLADVRNLVVDLSHMANYMAKCIF